MYNLTGTADGIDILENGSGSGMYITHNGTGNGIYSHVVSGRSAWLDNTSATTTNELLYANNVGKGYTGKFITNNSAALNHNWIGVYA